MTMSNTIQNFKRSRTVIFGAGGNAKVIKEILLLLKYDFIGFVSSEPQGTIIDDFPILCGINNFMEEYQHLNIENGIVSIGDNYHRQKIVESLEKSGIHFVNAIHPSAIISPSAKIGRGVFVAAGSIIQPHAIIGNHCVINTKASVDHDSIIEEFASLAPGATICGKVKIAEGSAVGPGAVVIEKTSIGKHCVVGANSVVINDFPDYCLLIGNPARIKRGRTPGDKYLR